MCDKLNYHVNLLACVPAVACAVACVSVNSMNNAIWISTLSRMSGFLWLSSKYACWFCYFVQYVSGLEVLACNFNTISNYVTTILQLHYSLSY